MHMYVGGGGGQERGLRVDGDRTRRKKGRKDEIENEMRVGLLACIDTRRESSASY